MTLDCWVCLGIGALAGVYAGWTACSHFVVCPIWKHRDDLLAEVKRLRVNPNPIVIVMDNSPEAKLQRQVDAEMKRWRERQAAKDAEDMRAKADAESAGGGAARGMGGGGYHIRKRLPSDPEDYWFSGWVGEGSASTPGWSRNVADARPFEDTESADWLRLLGLGLGLYLRRVPIPDNLGMDGKTLI